MMKKGNFPNLSPLPVDDPILASPTIVHAADLEWEVIPGGGGKVKYLLTEKNAGCKNINMGLFLAQSGDCSPWHTHPCETQEEEYLYVLEGQGTLNYKQGGVEHAIELNSGDGVLTGHLTHCLKNPNSVPLLVLFSISPLPETNRYFSRNKTTEHIFADLPSLTPPQLVRTQDVAEVKFGNRGIMNRQLLFPHNVGCKRARFGIALEKTGQGSQWHTHPIEAGEEDLFYIASGHGTMFYLQGGQCHSAPFKKGDAIHSHHLTNYTINTGTEDVYMPFVNAPIPTNTILHKG